MIKLTDEEQNKLVGILEAHISSFNQSVSDEMLQKEVDLFNKVASYDDIPNVLTVEYVRTRWLKPSER